MWTWVACHDSAHGRVRMAPAFDNWVPINKQTNSYTLWMSLSSKWQLSQQRCAMPRSTVPSRKSATDAAIQLLSPVLGSSAVVAVVVLGLEDVDTVVLVTVVAVLVVVPAGFSEGFAVGPVVGSPAAGLASAGDLSTPPPGTTTPSVSPAGGVAPSGSITTCGATTPAASTTPPAPKVPPAGVTNRADTSDPPVHATPPSAPVASSHEASTESRQPAASALTPASLLAPGDFSR